MKDEGKPVMIRNRDIIKLSRVVYVMQDVSTTERKRLWQQDRIWNITQKLTGMPGGHGAPTGLDDILSSIAEIEEQYEADCAEYMKELREAESIINGIKSREMRTFVTMKYMLDISNREIMAKLNMKRWRFDDICQRIEQAQDMAHVQWPERYMLTDA